MHLWDRILDQAQTTLNMLRPSILNLNISAHTMMEGNFYFKNIPLAPPETKVVLHENPNRRRTWGHHRVKVWYIGPTVEHYRCYKVYIYNKT